MMRRGASGVSVTGGREGGAEDGGGREGAGVSADTADCCILGALSHNSMNTALGRGRVKRKGTEASRKRRQNKVDK